MFYHIVLMSLSEQADRPFFAQVQAYVGRVRAECPDIVTYFANENVSSRGDDLTYSVVGVFQSSEAHDIYQRSPAHQEMKAFITPYIERIVVLDSEETK